MKEFSSAQKIADVGVTSESVSPEANVLETLYPHKDRITAMGIEDADHLEERFPGLKFKKIHPGQPLPFENNTFDVVYSHAVIEHIVEDRERELFLSEILRVGKAAFITTPNKYFPVEVHTFIPVLHFLWPRMFYALINNKILNRFYNSSNLKLLSYGDIEKLARALPGISYEIQKVTLFGVTSNLILVIKKINS